MNAWIADDALEELGRYATTSLRVLVALFFVSANCSDCRVHCYAWHKLSR